MVNLKSKFAKTVFILSNGKAVTLVLGILTTMLWSRHFEKEVFGQYQLVLSILRFTSSFCFAGLATSLSLSSSKNIDGNFSLIIKKKVAINCVGVIPLLVCSFYYWYESKYILASVIAICAILFPIWSLDSLTTTWIKGKKQFKLSTKIEIIFSILNIGLVLSIIFFTNKKLLITASIIFISQSLFTLSTIVWQLKKKVKNQAKDQKLIRYGYHTSLASILGGFLLFDVVLISKYLSLDDVAVYCIAFVIPKQLKSIYNIFSTIISPNLNQANSMQEAWEALKPKFSYLTILFISLGFLGFLALPFIVPLLFSNVYIEAAQYSKWLWLGLAFNVPTTFLGDVLRAQQKIKFIYFFQIFTPIFNVIIFWGALVLGYQLWGVIIAKLISYLSGALISSISFCYFLYFERKQTNI